jgi:murein L,D-transpeptidase YcbB/YkuD
MMRKLVLLGMLTLISGAGAVLPAKSAGDTDDPPLRLLLNVPAHRLYVFENGEHTRTFRISVGLPGYETPSGQYRVSEVIWNPWWHPPPSDWARNRTVEPPGPDNPMGRVKMYFAPLLYIHGSPEVGMLGRAASRGCIRMHNEEAMELARLIHRYTTPNVNDQTLATLAANEQMTRTFRVSRGVPFRVIYEIAEVRDGFLIIYPDVYDKVGDRFDDEVRMVLTMHGLDPDRVNQEHLARLLSKSRDGAIVSASLDELARGMRGVATGSEEGR